MASDTAVREVRNSLDFREILKQAKRGVHQAPTLDGYRHPKIAGWKELATTSREKIRAMAAGDYAECNWVSVARNEFACIIDVDDLETAIAMGMPIPQDTFIVNSPSGGIHIYLWHTKESVELGNTDVEQGENMVAEFKAHNKTCASPGVYRSDKEPHGCYQPANDNEIQPIRNELVEWLRTHGTRKRKYDAKAPKRAFHLDYELADEIEHYEWQMTGEEKTTPDGLRLFEFAVCPICDEVHRDMAKGSFKCCLTIGDYGLGFIWQGTRHSDATIKDVWEACEDRGCEPFPYYRYADEDPADFLNQGTADRHAVKLPKVYPLTDMGNAERFEQHFASEFIWTKETGWLAYRDGVWEEDKTAEADQAMQITVRLITQEAELVEGDDEAAENMRDAIIGWAKQSEANAKIKAALERASKLKAFARSYAEFDRQPNLFNCANGTIDLNTMEFRAHDPNDLLTKISPISYSPDAQCPGWEKFVLEVMGGKEHMMRYLQRWMGYTMTANTGEQCMAVPYGRGGTGKSTFLHVMAGVLGDYAKTADAEMLMAKRGDAGQPFEMAGMEGTRLLFAIETEEGKTLATAKVKRMTGQDPMKACYKFQNHFEFVPVWKIWLATNDQPNVRALDDAYWDRVKVVPFTVKFRDTEKQVRDLDEKLLTEEGSGILNWCVAGCREWKRIGLQHPEEVNIAVKEWREREDYLARFLEERTEATDKPDEFVQRSKLFESFSRRAEETKEGRGLKEKTFVEDMKRKGYTPDSIKQGGKTMRVWMNLKLTSLLGEYGPQVRPEDVM